MDGEMIEDQMLMAIVRFRNLFVKIERKYPVKRIVYFLGTKLHFQDRF